MEDLIYKYSYGDEDVLGSEIKIFRKGNNDEYIVDAEFIMFNDNLQPTLHTSHTIVTHDKDTNTDSEDLITIKHKIKIIAKCNPPPETIVKFIRK